MFVCCPMLDGYHHLFIWSHTYLACHFVDVIFKSEIEVNLIRRNDVAPCYTKPVITIDMKEELYPVSTNHHTPIQQRSARTATHLARIKLLSHMPCLVRAQSIYGLEILILFKHMLYIFDIVFLLGQCIQCINDISYSFVCLSRIE